MVILRVALFQPLRMVFDYLPSPDMDMDAAPLFCRIRIPFRGKEHIGIVIGISHDTDIPQDKLKQALTILDKTPVISKEIIELCQFVAHYYLHPLGDVLGHAIPAMMRAGQSLKKIIPLNTQTDQSEVSYSLTLEQQKAVDIMDAHPFFQVFLLYGVTGSGKTTVYITQIKKILAQGKQVLFLVPEIALTPQMLENLELHLAEPVVAVHSGLTQKQKTLAWHYAKNSQAKIILGTRSSIFFTLPNLGLIIVDEEHDLSYKQQDGLRYHARDIAIWRAKQNNIPIILGSATPSAETWYNTQHQRFIRLDLPSRATGVSLPKMNLIDMRNYSGKIFSPELLTALQETLMSERQALLFLNRRGFSPVFYCPSCAWIAKCSRCHARLVFHQSGFLKCHRCDIRCPLPSHCPELHGNLLPIGFGTQRIETILQDYFKDVPLIRLDRDSTKRKGDLQQLLSEIHQHKKAILLGTQILAKGHHFPNVNMVGILDVDAGFLSADFRAPELEGQRLWQVAGRAGREKYQGHVYVQTRLPDMPLLNTLCANGYTEFMKNILQERYEAQLPPFNYAALFVAKCPQLATLKKFFEEVELWLSKKQISPQLSYSLIWPHVQIKKNYQGKILFLTNLRKYRNEVLNQLVDYLMSLNQFKRVQWLFDIDPMQWF